MLHRLIASLSWIGLWSWRRFPAAMVWLAGFLLPLWVTGCGATTVVGSRRIPEDRIREVCWKPAELGPQVDHFVFVDDGGTAASEAHEADFAFGVARGGFVFKYDEDAPVKNLRLLPLSRPEAWCSNIPGPTDEKTQQLLELCPLPTSTSDAAAAKHLMGQTEASIRSPFLCNQAPRMAPTPQETILLRARNDAYQDAYRQARAIAMALTRAEADLQSLSSQSKWSLKRLILKDPGTLEQIQQRIADALSSIEAPPSYDDPILDSLALAGFRMGFDDGQFEVEAKLFAIDVGVLLVEVALLEVALGPLGGAKLLASAVSKGTRSLRAATARLADIPIFIPGAAGGAGGFVRVGNALKSLSRYHARRLEAALEAEGKIKLATEETHHIVAQGSDKAKKSRDILAKFNIDIDHPANGVFLPANKSSPNPSGSIVHKILGNNKEYYKRVENYLAKATSQADALQRLRYIGETLKDGTFFHAHL